MTAFISGGILSVIYCFCAFIVRRKIYLPNHSQLLLMKTERMLILSKLEMSSYSTPAPGGQATIPFLALNHSRVKTRS